MAMRALRLFSAKRAMLVAAGAAMAMLTLGTTISSTYDPAGQFTGFSIGASDACATDGSCGPAPAYICGLNGKSYVDKVYIDPT